MSNFIHPSLERLKALKPKFSDMNLKRVRVFGSVIRGDAKPDSDIDLLVEFYKDPTLFDLGGLQTELEEKLGCSVDISMPSSLIPELRDIILNEAQDV